MLDIQGDGVFDKGNRFFRIAAGRILAVNVNTCCLVVKLSPLRSKAGGLLKISCCFRARAHGTIGTAASEKEERFVRIQVDRMGVIGNSCLALVQRVFRLGTAQVRIPVPGVVFQASSEVRNGLV